MPGPLEPPEPLENAESPETAQPARGGRLADPDVDPHAPRRSRGLRDAPWAVLAAVSAGGALGAAARSGAGLLLAGQAQYFPWSTLLVNVSGCLLIGVLMTVVAHARPDSRLLRPFAGVGVLGGYTTFSAHVADAHALLTGGAPIAALAYIGATLLCGLAAVWAGVALTERMFGRADRERRANRERAANRPAAGTGAEGRVRS